MAARLKHFCFIVAAVFSLLWTATAHSQSPQFSELTPTETVFIANVSDAALCRDFSPLLSKLRVEWLILDDEKLPAAYHDKDLIVIGEIASQATNPLIRSLLSADDIAQIERDGSAVLQKEHPSNPDRMLILAVGIDQLMAKTAAENAAEAVLEAAPPRALWY